MKKAFIILSLVLLSGAIIAQENTQKKPIAFDLTGGARIGAMETANTLIYTPSGADLGVNFGVRYMLYNLTDETFFSSLGLKLDFGYDQASAEMTSGGTTTGQILRIGGHLIFDFNDIYDMGVDGLGIYLHGGCGASFLSNPDGNLTGNFDKMPNLVFGITPEYRFHPNVAVIADVSVVGLFMQDHGIEGNSDFLSGAPSDKYFTPYLSASIGLSFRIGESYDSVPFFE
jgi:hypothetical protein